jgi:2-amino-4-hydroxy-6-hydroxymethyldihydropteridine diphosphokinase
MRAGIALGSNIGDRLQNLREAAARVGAIHGVEVPLEKSRIYETQPVGCEPGTPSFLNAAMEFGWSANPLSLLNALCEIEHALGREAQRLRNTPRTIDLDVLYVGNSTITHDGLLLPHPRLHERRFVLAPLSDIRPDLVLPGQTKPVAKLLDELPENPRVVATDFSF